MKEQNIQYNEQRNALADRPARVKTLARRATALVASSVLLSGCSDIKQGVVYEKEHNNAYMTTVIVGGRPMVVPHPEEFLIDFQQCDKPTEPRTCETGEESVDEETYNRIQIGQYVDFSKN